MPIDTGWWFGTLLLFVHIHTYLYIHTYIFIYIYIYVYMYTCVCTYILGMSSSQLTFIFFRTVQTTNQYRYCIANTQLMDLRFTFSRNARWDAMTCREFCGASFSRKMRPTLGCQVTFVSWMRIWNLRCFYGRYDVDIDIDYRCICMYMILVISISYVMLSHDVFAFLYGSMDQNNRSWPRIVIGCGTRAWPRRFLWLQL